jgi:hypothetical protein
MKHIFKLTTLIFISFLFFSCDPSRNINFVNQTEAPVKIKFKLSHNKTSQSLEELAKGDSIVLNLKPKGTEYIYCGMGTWSENEVDNIAKGIENIEIETKDIKTVYKSRNSIIEILKDNRKGLWWKTSVEIEVE